MFFSCSCWTSYCWIFSFIWETTCFWTVHLFNKKEALIWVQLWIWCFQVKCYTFHLMGKEILLEKAGAYSFYFSIALLKDLPQDFMQNYEHKLFLCVYSCRLPFRFKRKALCLYDTSIAKLSKVWDIQHSPYYLNNNPVIVNLLSRFL